MTRLSAAALTTSTVTLKQHDKSGYAYFADGVDGYAHDLAHRALDEGRIEEGYHELSAILEQHGGNGSRWVHVHWHMAVFEIALGMHEAALGRFDRHILPAALAHTALTDAPSLMWRLALAGPDIELPWAIVGAVAKAQSSLDAGANKPFVALHNLLALAGAGDVVGLLEFLGRPVGVVTPISDPVLDEWARAFVAYVAGDFAEAAERMAVALPRQHLIGGSHAQQQLFHAIAADARRRVALPGLRKGR